MVKYIYTGELEEEILTQHATAFLELYEMFDIQELKNSAEVELLRLLDKDKMVKFLSIGLDMSLMPKRSLKQPSRRPRPTWLIR